MAYETAALPANILPTGLEVKVSAPGKVILHGEHSVVYGKLAISGSLGLRSSVKLLEIAGPNLVVVQIPVLDFVATYDLEKLKQLLLSTLPLTFNASDFNWDYPDMIHHAALVDVCESFIDSTGLGVELQSPTKMCLTAMFFLLSGILGSINLDLTSFLIASESQLSAGAGTGSSASFSVSFVGALVQYIKIKTKGEGNVSREGYKPYFFEEFNLDKFSGKELDLINKWAFCAEKIFHSNPSGVDNTICTYGGIVEFRKGLPPKLLSVNTPLKVFLINTKVQRQTKKMVGKLLAFHEQYPDLTNNILNAMEDVAFIALRHITTLTSLPEIAQQQSDEVVKQSYDELGRLMKMNHNLLCALGVSHIKLDEIVFILAENGLQGKLTGAGGGGYAICLIPPHLDPDFVQRVMWVLTSKGFDVTYTDLGASGVSVD